jgi:putative endonuclease
VRDGLFERSRRKKGLQVQQSLFCFNSMAFFIYILYSTSSDIYYVGYTEDVSRRIIQHNNPQRTKFTSKHLPWVLKCSIEISNTRSAALMAEKHIKRQKNKKYIEALILSEEKKVRLQKKVLQR